MHTAEKNALVNSIGKFIAERIAVLGDKLNERLASIEARTPVRGEKGEKGEKGDAGERGEAGSDGLKGADGKDGLRGEKGETGERGEKGERGPEGQEGKQGRDGRDGLAGIQGEKGTDGKDGINGKDGRDGIDALGMDHFDVLHDGERTFTFQWANGERKEERKFVIPCVLDRGVYRSEHEYEKGDAVTYAGCIWIAQQQTKMRPGTPGSEEWRLSVKAGRDGKDGKLIPEKPREPIKI